MLHTIMAALVINNTTINIIRNDIGFDVAGISSEIKAKNTT
jgi:hypothetical protein